MIKGTDEERKAYFRETMRKRRAALKGSSIPSAPVLELDMLKPAADGMIEWQDCLHKIKRSAPMTEEEYVSKNMEELERAIAAGEYDGGEPDLDGRRERARKYAHWRWRGFVVDGVKTL